MNVEAFERVVDHVTTDTERRDNPPNGPTVHLHDASTCQGDAARQLPRLTIALAEAICNCRDAVARM
jgi:hypothetical protein